MRLVYKATQKPVAIGDAVTVDGVACTVSYFRPPHAFYSEGKVVVRENNNDPAINGREYYVSVISAHWIEREDREVFFPKT